MNKSVNEEDSELLTVLESDRHFLSEIKRKTSEGTLFKFTNTVLQYGFLTLFITALPLLGILALFENIIVLRLDAWKLCTIYRRPHITIAEDVGFWRTLMTTMGTIAIVINSAIICFTSESLNKYTLVQKWLIFLIMEQILLLLKILVHRNIETVPAKLRNIELRQKYIIGKFLHGVEDSDENDTEIMNIKGNFDDSDDMLHQNQLGNNNNNNPSQINKDNTNSNTNTNNNNITNKNDIKLGENNYSRLEELENIRRELLRELRLIKEQLQSISKTEVFNPQTGIGETKHGLPLGRLTVRLVEMQNLVDELKDSKLIVKVKVYIENYHKDNKKAFISSSIMKADSLQEYTASYPLSSSIIAFNQSIGPFAPIKTLDADIIFDVIDTSPDANDAILASATVKLRDLTDQQQHDKVLHLKTRTETGELELAKNSKAKLFVQLVFMFSNIVPLKTKIYHLQDQLRQVDKEVYTLRSGV
eukprot:gene10566-22045_t